MTGRLDGKVAFVTGGSSGIGRAVAVRFANEGSSVVIVDTRPMPKEGGEPTHELIRGAGGRGVFVEADITLPDAVGAAVSSTVETFGDLHIAFCGAGVRNPIGDTREIAIAEFDRHMAVNVRGVFLCAQEALRYMVPRRYGKLILVASNFGLVGVDGLAVYCASKAAVIGLSKALAVEYGASGVNVNALCPGATKTSINSDVRAIRDTQLEWQRITPLRMADGEYLAEPNDIADAALFLASEESRFMTGATLVVDGGWIAH